MVAQVFSEYWPGAYRSPPYLSSPNKAGWRSQEPPSFPMYSASSSMLPICDTLAFTHRAALNRSLTVPL